MRVFLYFAREYPWESLVVLLCLLAAALVEGIGVSAILPLTSLVTSGQSRENESGFEESVRGAFEALGVEPSIGLLLWLVVVAFALKAVIRLLANRQVGYTVAQVATELRLALLRALLSTRWSYYTRQPLGAVANAMATEANRASRTYQYLALIVAAAIQILLYMGIAIAVSWRATIAAALVGGFTLWALNGLVLMAARAGRRQTKVLKSLLGRLTDSLQSVKLLKATGRETLIGPLLENDTLRLNRALRKQVLGKEAVRSLQEPILIAFACAGLYMALSRWNLPKSTLTVFGIAFLQVLTTINKMQRQYQHMVTDASALWSLRSMTGQAEAAREPTGGTRQPSLEREVTLEGVRLDYNEQTVLDDVFIEIPAGEIAAIVGPSGAGKTTIIDLITGLVQPDEGQVRIDGIPLAELDLKRWRQMLGYVPQEMLLLHETVEMNITLGDPSLSAAEVERALRDAGAWEFVSKLPEGPAASVGERGTLFSGGQRQRIAIARALVHRPKLLIFDEATAALDPKSESEVWATVERLRGKTTIVAVSHQPALAGVADRIYRIENGRAELLPRSARPPVGARVMA